MQLATGPRAPPDGGDRRTGRPDRRGRRAAGAVRAGGALRPGGDRYAARQASLTPASGPVTLTPRWAAQTGCPRRFQGSAALYELNTNGSIGRRISPVVYHVRAPFQGRLLGPVGRLITRGTDVRNGGTSHWVVGCYAWPWPLGRPKFIRSAGVTLSQDGSRYSTSTPGLIATTTTLTASPNPAGAGATVTLTATVTATDGKVPPGKVEFAAGSTVIAMVPLDASGVATTTTTFAAPGPVSLSASLLDSGPSYAASSGRYDEAVTSAGGDAAGAEPITTTVPASGAFTLTIAAGTVTLTAPDPQSAAGTLQDVTVTDTRNNFPGWSVSGQASGFTGSGPAAGQTIPGDQLGWTPGSAQPLPDATLGPAVTPAAPGLGTTAATLASAPPGHGSGTSVLSAQLSLAIPQPTTPGPYTGSLTITAVTAAP